MASLFAQDFAEWFASVKRTLVDVEERLSGLVESAPEKAKTTLVVAHLRTLVAAVESTSARLPSDPLGPRIRYR